MLIADDHAQMRYVLRQMVEGWEVVGEAENGQQAVAAAEKLLPDLILLDVSMPVMNGFEAARLLRKRLPDLQIIFISAHVDRAYADEAFQIGAQGYVVKRALATELAEALRAVQANQTFHSPLIKP